MAERIYIYTGVNEQLSALYSVPEKTPPEPSPAPDENAVDTLLVMVHGFPGHKAGNNDLYGDLEFMLADKGHHVLRFDFRGCGHSDGKEEAFTFKNAADDLRNIVKWGKERGYKKFFIIAEGLGATITIMNISKDICGLILLWPILDVQLYYTSNFASLEVDDDFQDKKYLKVNKHRYGVDFIRELKQGQLVTDLHNVSMPTLILHGARDEIVPIEHLDLARRYMNARRVEITTFHDGEHGLQKLSHRKMMFYHITQFAAKYG